MNIWFLLTGLCAGFALGAIMYRHFWRKMTHQYGETAMVLHGPHSHKCKCGHAWSHDDTTMLIGNIYDDHVCTKCGNHVVEIYNSEHAHVHEGEA